MNGVVTADMDLEAVSKLVEQLTPIMDGSSLADLSYAIGVMIGEVEDCTAMKGMCMAIAAIASVTHNENFHGTEARVTH